MVSNCDKSFSRSYMLLNPEDVGVIDLMCILFSNDIEKRKFVDCPEGITEESFKRRWIIFVSILAQKFLKFASKPMAASGAAIEYWLNLVSCNRNIGRLLWNFVRGKMVRPVKTSPTFTSFIGNLDKRVEIDTSIQPGNLKYNSLLAIMAAKASYENKAYIEAVVNDCWKMEFIGFYDFWNDYQGKATTQAFICRDRKDSDSELIIVAFRGTEPFDADAWSSDFDLSWYELPRVGKVHGGFMKALGLQKNQGWPKNGQTEWTGVDQPTLAYYAIRDVLKQELKRNDKAKFILTGHSLGGSLAILFPAVLAFHKEEDLMDRLEGVYTFGQPRVGDEKFGEFMKEELRKHSVNYYRFVYSNDLVPRLPYDDSTLMFKHFGTCLYYNSFYAGRIVEEEPNKNYFSPLSAIPKVINATWELIRSFVVPYTRGSKYKEGSLLRVFRVIGLIVAGVPAHCPHDYLNSILIDSFDFCEDLYKNHGNQSMMTNIN